MEVILRTTEVCAPGSWATGRTYLLHRGDFTPGWMVTAAALVLVALLGAYGAPALTGRSPGRASRPGSKSAWPVPRDRLRAELRWYVLVVVWSVLLAASLDLPVVARRRPGPRVLAAAVVWQATAREYQAVAVLVLSRGNPAWVRGVLARRPGLRRIDRGYCGPEAEALEAASSLGIPDPVVLEDLSEIGKRAELSKDDIAAILAEPDKAIRCRQTVAAALERLQAVFARIDSDVKASSPTTPSIALVILPAGLATLRAVAASAARRMKAREGKLPEWRAKKIQPLWAGETWTREVARHTGRVGTVFLAVADFATNATLKQFNNRRPVRSAARLPAP